MRLHSLFHVPFEGLGAIEPWALRRGHRLTATRLYAADPLPALDHFDWLVVMGGPMSVWEEGAHPWLTGEKRFIERAVDAGKIVLGVCLGAQLLAEVLGARVYPGRHKEIGWFPVEKVFEGPPRCNSFAWFPARAEVFHWHGDTFDLPAGAIWEARSDAYPHQAFAFGPRVLALQFHLELTLSDARTLIQRCAPDLAKGPYVQDCETILSDPLRFARLNALLNPVLDALDSARA